MTYETPIGANMFAYCMNNPVMGVDLDGKLPYPGLVHNKVVNHIAKHHGFHAEQTILYDGGRWGRADLISPNGEIWDVKPNKERHIRRGAKQVENYVAGVWVNNTNNVPLDIGGPIRNDTFSFEDSSILYTVNYHYARDGVIVYDYSTELNKNKVANAAGAVGSAGALYTMYKAAQFIKRAGWVMTLLPP